MFTTSPSASDGRSSARLSMFALSAFHEDTLTIALNWDGRTTT